MGAVILLAISFAIILAGALVTLLAVLVGRFTMPVPVLGVVPVAEHALGLMIALSKKIGITDKALRSVEKTLAKSTAVDWFKKHGV